MLAGGAIDAVGFWRFLGGFTSVVPISPGTYLVVFGHVSGAVKVASGRVSDLWILYGYRVSEQIGFYRFLGVTILGCFGFLLCHFWDFSFAFQALSFLFSALSFGKPGSPTLTTFHSRVCQPRVGMGQILADTDASWHCQNFAISVILTDTDENWQCVRNTPNWLG